MFVIDYRINNSRHKLLRTNNDVKQVLVDENYIDEYRITRSIVYTRIKTKLKRNE